MILYHTKETESRLGIWRVRDGVVQIEVGKWFSLIITEERNRRDTVALKAFLK